MKPKTISTTPTYKSLIKHFGGIQSFTTGKNEVWCSKSHWADEKDCTVVDGFILCKIHDRKTKDN